jgi:hypothetical protein
MSTAILAERRHDRLVTCLATGIFMLLPRQQ